ncbi:type II secretion system protein GspJ [Simiduia agarivorans]|uniref:Type II secretion system protein J n=1 Tax=Simiduia agarivorans (strain DSM 21679 / JCM 13881 / BCRC 17597 / SA1) TaxID=1117647 RepID=K4KKA6_SIMAS|nr:type II secretion system protein GspJ [Simiduia agarivorans]AFU99589.1 general secretion pathway protein J [Simiduia agarivorans SA1 = DSM 21679]
MHRARGFTLVEVLIAIFIAALIAMMAAQSFHVATRSMESGRAVSTQFAELDRFFIVIEQDLRSIRGGKDALFKAEEVDQTLSGAEATEDQTFLGYGEAFETRDIKQQRKNLLATLDRQHRLLQFVRGDWVNFGISRRSDLQHVTYAWHQGALWRFFRPIDREIFGEQAPGDEVYFEDVSMARRLLTDVNNLTFRYLAPGANPKDESGWSTEWPPSAGRTGRTTQASLPSAVEIAVELKDMGEIKRVLLLGIEE